ncbi:hypothetical protein KC19_5G092000 [Ceratodon purpureus]|uniref:Uncharacterized protein n=1 Tax=Ceratodon purpureus TaxID=3225 RepID=A0A8T0HZI6_CERPU|nr:hypothetical protein KC19_5G092000 [Ceratodon purpureus]
MIFQSLQTNIQIMKQTVIPRLHHMDDTREEKNETYHTQNHAIAIPTLEYNLEGTKRSHSTIPPSPNSTKSCNCMTHLQQTMQLVLMAVRNLSDGKMGMIAQRNEFATERRMRARASQRREGGGRVGYGWRAREGLRHCSHVGESVPLAMEMAKCR